MSTILSSKFATYQSMGLCLDFHLRGNEVFVEKKAEQGVIQYPLDLSSSSLEKVPPHVRLSAEKMVQWLIHHRYAPVINAGKVIFYHKTTLNTTDFALHEAVSRGDLIAVKLWIEANKPLDILNGFQKTPLYLATIHNHLEIVDCLLNAGSTPIFPGSLQETILHVAAFYGHEALLKQLLVHPEIQKYLNAQDREGRQPLHKAFLKKQQPHITELLLTSGSAVYQKDHKGNTPLHGAVKSGCLKSVELLLQKGALISEKNHQHETPLDLALTPYRYAIAYHLLKITPSLPPPQGCDRIAYYANLLLEAKKIDSIKEQVMALIGISDEYIQQNLSQEKNPLAQYQKILSAAKFLNAALAILEKAPERMKELEEAVFKKISKIEHRFIKGEGSLVSDESELLHSYRVYLKAYRKTCEMMQADPFKATQAFSEDLALFLQNLIQKGISIFGPPPVKWAAMSMGSMARKEMCPYSDVDFGFLIESATPSALSYFRRLSQFLQLRITNMGETPFPVFGGQELSPTPQGLRFDGIGESELIGTPLYFAGFQTARRMEENIIFTNVLNCTDYLDGDLELVRMYEQERKRISSQKTGTPSIPFHKMLGLHLLEGHLLEFKPNLSLEKEELKAFGIKKELYRPLQEVINGLALFFDIKEKNSLERIDALAKLKVFSERGAGNIKKAFKSVLSLRLKAHLFYKSEEEILFHKEPGQIEDPHKLYIDSSTQSQLKEIYGLLLPFFASIQQFIKSPDPTIIYKNDFAYGLYSPNAVVLSFKAEYKKAEEAFQQALALDPNDMSSLLEMSAAEEELGDPVNALKRAQHAIKVAIELPDSLQKEYRIAQAYQHMGNAFHRMGNYEEALNAGEQFLSILLALGDICDKIMLIYAYDLIGRALQMLKRYEEAREYFHAAIRCFEEKLISLKDDEGGPELYILKHTKDIAAIYNNIGLVLRKMDSLDEALKYYEIALEMKLSCFGRKHPEVATSYGNIGVLLFAQKKYSEALKYHAECHSILTSIFGDNHPDVGLCCDEIGLCLQGQGKWKEAVAIHQVALAILTAVYGTFHPDVILTKSHLMQALTLLELYEKNN
ncbi:ankyrin repeat domain-containing protein [Rhabdochlamydiaceae symbiont of Dictyostelium giganteum]|uniref:ankyrin repeat domain-containing protein n=1 Tax=Rhabdochlamydiaceae symbiont of Dictyostelium giganteum TaxID=3342349 RepID=UPI00384D7495